jgi:hypothetical protein
MLERVALYTTVYPAVVRYLPDWYASVMAQTDRAFDLWIGVDGMSREAVATALGATPRACWVLAEPGDTPTSIRARAIERMVAEYDAVIFVDSDDLLAPARVAAARAALEEADVAACALRIIDEQGSDLGLVFGPAPDERPTELLPRYNVFGLSNTAYRSAVLRECLPIPATCVLVDWLLATRALGMGAALAFDATPLMAYRQYAANVARVLPPFGADEVLRAAQRVLNHYDCVLAPSHPVPADLRAVLQDARRRVRSFYLSLAASEERRRHYVNALNALPPRYVWWWCVAHPNLEDVWRN